MTAICVFAAMLPLAAALTGRLLHQFPSAGQHVENLALLPNGDFLVTTFNQARVYKIDPHRAAIQALAQVSGADSVTGIAPTSKNTYAASAGYFDPSDNSFHSGSAKVVVLNVQACERRQEECVKTVARLPQVRLLNGMVSLPHHPHVVLCADSKTGTIYRVDTRNGRVDIAIRHDVLAPGLRPRIALGVNGIRIHGGYLYVSHSGQQFVGRYKINRAGMRRGDLEIIAARAAGLPDDFAIARNGTIYLADHDGGLIRIAPGGERTTMAKGDSAGVYLDAPTSVALSRDEKTVFLTTGGNSTKARKGGQIVVLQ